MRLVRKNNPLLGIQKGGKQKELHLSEKLTN